MRRGKLADDLPIGNAREARRRLAALDQRREALHALGADLVREFREQFPNAPAYLTRYSDRTYTAYRWRRSSHKKWRGSGPRGVNLSVELASPDGRRILGRLPAAAARTWLGYERRRISLNLAVACIEYERARIRDYLARLDALRDLDKDLSKSR